MTASGSGALPELEVVVVDVPDELVPPLAPVDPDDDPDAESPDDVPPEDADAPELDALATSSCVTSELTPLIALQAIADDSANSAPVINAAGAVPVRIARLPPSTRAQSSRPISRT